MSEKIEITKFTAGEPCKGPRGWLCVEIGKTVDKDLIFKIVE